MSFNDLIKESVKNSPEGSLRRIQEHRYTLIRVNVCLFDS